MTLYTSKSKHLTPINIPSFTFDQEQFRALSFYIAEKALSKTPASMPFTLGKESWQTEIKQESERGATMRLVLSIFILVGLLLFLVRKTSTTYEFNLGNKEARSGNLKEAKQHFLKAIACDPTFPMSWHALATCEFKLKNPRQAEEYWHKALLYKPDLVPAKEGLAQVYLSRGDEGQALNLLNSAIRLSPHDITAYIMLCQYYLGKQDQSQANNYFLAACREANGDPNSYLRCAQLALELGRQEEAIKLAQRALALDPRNERAKAIMESGAKGNDK
jgi:tetratricopeptide (TPR) repeat protein